MTERDSAWSVAAIQMVSAPRLADNLARMHHWVDEAAAQGAQLVLLPEYFCLMGLHDRDKLSIAEAAGSEGPIQTALAEAARRTGVWLVGGTIPLQTSDPDRVFNAMLVFDPQGRRVARYDKLHLFSFQKGEERYDESQSILRGTGPVACDLPMGRTALSVCYDIRFPEFYRELGRPQPLDLILVSAAFTATTGRAHWEVLLRARAIENQCWLLASAQGGLHESGRRTWGHSMLIDPWGQVVACRDEAEGLVVGRVDSTQTHQVRLNLPALTHRIL